MQVKHVDNVLLEIATVKNFINSFQNTSIVTLWLGVRVTFGRYQSSCPPYDEMLMDRLSGVYCCRPTLRCWRRWQETLTASVALLSLTIDLIRCS